MPFVVSDTGVGISETQAQNLFKAFAQGDATVTRNFGGTGLGLVITKRLCQMMGGDFYLMHSDLGAGVLLEMEGNGVGILHRLLKQRETYDLVLLDIQMPVMDGIQTIRELRMVEYSGPVVALTAHSMEEEMDHILHAGFSGFISKPVTSESLIVGILKYLSMPSNPIVRKTERDIHY